VRVKSGGPIMTVEQVGKTTFQEDAVWCVWFEKVGNKQVAQKETFPPVVLEKTEKPRASFSGAADAARRPLRHFAAGDGWVFPSVGRFHLPAIRLERTVCDLYGHQPTDAPDHRAWLDHGQWGLRAPLGARSPARACVHRLAKRGFVAERPNTPRAVDYFSLGRTYCGRSPSEARCSRS
jgi:uncharacterized protein YodC (DUF2158 family)